MGPPPRPTVGPPVASRRPGPGRPPLNVRQFAIYDADDQLKYLLVSDLVIERQVSAAETLIFMENNDAE